MKNGFYGIRQAGADQDPLDPDAWGLAMLAHFKDGRAVGVDQGGCSITGVYAGSPDGGVSLRMSYRLKSGSHLPDGSVLQADDTLEREIVFTAAALDGAHQLIDVGLGPMFLKLEWLADAA